MIRQGSSGEPMDWHELDQRLAEFEQHLATTNMKPSARATYADQAGRFLRWLNGDYRPRNAASGPGVRTRRGHSWTVPELKEELEAYREELVAARLQPRAINTYVYVSAIFVRWLGGTYNYRGPHSERARTNGDDSWLDESRVQAHVVRWLEESGWRIVRQAYGREHGTDVDAERGGERISVEVKGHPRRLHVAGANKGRARRWHPGAQVRTYYGNALHAAMTMLHADPDRHVAIAFPDLPDYRGLVERSREPIRRLGIRIWFVAPDGTVSDV
jgi:hypothetical protein